MFNPKGRPHVNRRVIATASVASLVAAGAAVAIAAPSQAALTTMCVGSAGAVTVPGDLVVPAGESCELSGTVVLGDTTVRAGSDLVLLDGAELQGSVSVRADAFIAAEESTVGGPLELRRAFGGYLIESSVADAVDARNGSYLFSLDSVHAGTVSSRGSEMYLESTTVNANVESRNDSYADVYDSTITGELLVAGINEGSMFCYSEVDGPAVWRGGAGEIQIGAQVPMPDCGFNVFGANVAINNNSGDILLSDNVVRGNLVCNNNTHAPVGEGNRVRGEARGQCAEIAPSGQSSISAYRAGLDRAEAAERKFEARLDRAEEAVAEAGPANLG